ncbi:MAG: B3/B4 domain-containing protein [Candidatus Cyclobacteriaceae bacterium M3_2C_046]
MELKVKKELSDLVPELSLGTIQGNVTNSAYQPDLWQEISSVIDKIHHHYRLENIKDQLHINATKNVYRKLGKDPNRYRPSAESLYRRIVKGNDLYQISTLVDIINLVSLKRGYSIGGFDLDKIRGNLELGIGAPNEPYEGIGRGSLNIENLPVFRDEDGGIGTPTSDHVRTAISLDTTRFFMVFNDYNWGKGLEEVLEETVQILQKYVGLNNVSTKIIGRS